MISYFPGTTVEVSRLERGSSRELFHGIFAAGGVTLHQVSSMTGLEPYMIQNWVKRGFLTSPVKRLYSEEQFARIIIINMLRESLQIDTVCELMQAIDSPTRGGEGGSAELYHRYVDMLLDPSLDLRDTASVKAAAERAVADMDSGVSGRDRQLSIILMTVYYAHTASRLRSMAAEMLSHLK